MAKYLDENGAEQLNLLLANKFNSKMDYIELTSPVRIWDLADGIYKLPAGCSIYYLGATSTTRIIIDSTGILFITHYSTTYKNWFILCADTSSSRYLYNGYTTQTNGVQKSFNLGNNYLTSISSYVKNNLTYSTSNTTYALSAYQGYLLDQNKADKTELPTKTSDLTNDSGFLTSHQDISGKEDNSNKVTSISSSSTNTQYPSAKCVYDAIPKITYSDTDLTAGTSTLATGTFYFVYE